MPNPIDPKTGNPRRGAPDGHPFYPRKDPDPGHVRDNTGRRWKGRGLAATLRLTFPDEIMALMYRVALGGNQPLLVEDQRYEHGMTVKPGASLTAEQTAVWMRMLELRRDGAPAQHVQLDAEVHSRSSVLDAPVDPSQLAGAVAAGRVDAVALYHAVRALAGRQVGVVDAESTELRDQDPALETGGDQP